MVITSSTSPSLLTKLHLLCRIRNEVGEVTHSLYFQNFILSIGLMKFFEKRGENLMEKAILHSDLNCFYASVEMMLNPMLRGKAVAVCGSTEDRHGIVLAKSEKAKKAGVKT